MEALWRRRGADPESLRALRNDFYKRHRSAKDGLSRIPPAQRRGLADQIEFHALRLERRIDSKLDDTTKLLFRTAAGQTLESVILRIATGRTTLCVSSQVGCAVGCVFCATTRILPRGQLSSAEILDQLVQANRLLAEEGRSVRNVVFMGMGEPLHNESALHDALRTLLSSRCCDLPARRVMVSTVGIPEAMIRLSATFPKIRLALSLHSAQPAVRQRLVPLASRVSLDELRDTLLSIQRQGGGRVMLEALLLDGINDDDSAADALIEYTSGLDVRINLMRYNAIELAAQLRPTAPANEERFAERLRRAGLEVTRRVSLGSDIAAACGQLAASSLQGGRQSG